jgi:hypothetical protein
MVSLGFCRCDVDIAVVRRQNDAVIVASRLNPDVAVDDIG